MQREKEMPKGQQTSNFEYLGSFSDADFFGGNLCEDDVFKFNVYAPSGAGGGKFVGYQSEGKGKYDGVSVYSQLCMLKFF